MEPGNFDHILSLIREDISKTSTMRDPIPPEIKLAITIRYLTTGSSFDDLSCQCRVHKSTIGL